MRTFLMMATRAMGLGATSFAADNLKLNPLSITPARARTVSSLAATTWKRGPFPANPPT